MPHRRADGLGSPSGLLMRRRRRCSACGDSCEYSSNQPHEGADMTGENSGGFWSSLPGLLTAVAAIVTAGTGAYLALHSQQPASAAKTQQTPSPPRSTTNIPHAPVQPAAYLNSTHHTGPMGPLERGISYSQGDLYDRPASSPEQCSQLCANDDRCVAVTFIISQQRCWIKSSLNPPQQSGDMVSARKRD
jgi:hypothetical protein